MINEVEDEPLFLKVKSRDNDLVGEIEIFKPLSCGRRNRSTSPDSVLSRKW